MFDIYGPGNFAARGKWSAKKILSCVVGGLGAVVLLSSCAHITLEPGKKDQELIGMESFARDVTVHLLDTSPGTYEKYQAMLVSEVAPGVMAQLKAKGLCAKSPVEIKSRVAAMSKAKRECEVKVEQTDFPSKVTPEGLVPVEVTGTIVVSTNEAKGKPSKFHFVYGIGTSKSTHKPIVASVTFSK
jgi:hypothetical protein